MTHTGVVRELNGQNALVVVDTSQCGSCSTRSTCYGLSGKAPEDRVLKATNLAGATVGDRVEVELQTRASMTAIFVTFLLPVAMLGIGYALSRSWGAPFGALGALVGLLLGFGLSWIINRRLSSSPGFGLTVVSVLEKGK